MSDSKEKHVDTKVFYDFLVTMNRILNLKETPNWLTFMLQHTGDWASYKTEKYYIPSWEKRHPETTWKEHQKKLQRKLRSKSKI